MAFRTIHRIWKKNGPEARAILKRTTPKFLRNRPVKMLDSAIPIFVFHSVEPNRFESQLRYLKENEYSTMTTGELDRSLDDPLAAGHRKVALTFDDATGSFWTVAYPLLRKYGFKAILFVIAGLVPDDETERPNLDDVWAGAASWREICEREARHPLCSWRELIEMHRSGIVDIQSHSLTHAKIPVSDEVVDFLGPRFDPCFFGNVDIPLSAGDNNLAPERRFRLGAPVYRSMPRLSGSPATFSDERIEDALEDFVRENGKESFFNSTDWHDQLESQYRRAKSAYPQTSCRDSSIAVKEAMRREFELSKKIIEDRITGKRVGHFCYPWFSGCAEADQIARDCGYRATHYGFEAPPIDASDGPFADRILRYSDDYVWSLPGKERRWPYTVWFSRIRALAARSI